MSLLTRRHFIAGCAALTVGGVLAACGDSEKPTGSADPQPVGTPSGGPGRVIALGQGPDADTLIALGIVPAAMSKGYLDHPLSWTTEALHGATPVLIDQTSGIPFEQIAALKPDLIVATTLFGFGAARPRLEAIAPVLGPPEGGARDESWQDMTKRVGERVGRSAEAQALVDRTEACITKLRDEHPAWQGRTYSFGPVLPGSPLYTVSSTEDVSAEFLDKLGLKLPESITSLPKSTYPGRAEIASESLELIEADAVMLAFYGGDTQRAEFEKRPLFQGLPAVKRGSYIAVDQEVGLGMAFPSALSIPYCLGRIAPQLDTALKATPTPTTS